MAASAGQLTRRRLTLASLSGYARLTEWRSGGMGAILRFHRVRPRPRQAFHPLTAEEVTPRFLDRATAAIRRWGYDIIPIGEVTARLSDPAARRFVVLTFDGASRDILARAYPVLKHHAIPFAVYLPTAFVDSVGSAWREGLAQVIATHARVSLVIDRAERRFKCESISQKYETYDYLGQWLRGLQPAARLDAISDLCKRHGVDLAGLSRDVTLGWDDIETLAADPLVTIGTATVNGSLLSVLPSGDAQREMRMGRAVAEAAIRRTLPHFAYPDGAADSFGRRETGFAEDERFATAVTGVAQTFRRGAPVDPLALPRLTWDGRVTSLSVMRAMLAGLS